MNKRKAHSPIQKGDEILADIYQKLCDIADKLNVEEEEPSDLSKRQVVDLEEQQREESSLNKDEYICEICGRSFSSERGLKTHKRKTHGIHM